MKITLGIFHVDNVKMIDGGKRVFVIGRKGAEKRLFSNILKMKIHLTPSLTNYLLRIFHFMNFIISMIQGSIDQVNIHRFGNT